MSLVTKTDILLCCALMVMSLCITWLLASSFPQALRLGSGLNVWFDADIARVQSVMTDWQGYHYRTSVHPLSSLLSYVPVMVVQVCAGVGPMQATDIVLSGWSALWIGLLYMGIRLAGLRRIEAATLAAIGMCSATAILMYSVPETYSLSSASVLIACILIRLPCAYRAPETVLTLASAASLSVTITNWTVGLITTAMRLPVKRAVQVSVNAFFVVTLLWSLQACIVKGTAFFIAPTEERHFLYPPTPSRVASVLHTVVISSVVAGGPQPTKTLDGITPVGDEHFAFGLTLNGCWPRNFVGWSATVLWLLLLALTVWGVTKGMSNRHDLAILLIPLVVNIGIHSIYGAQTFLYAGNWLPYLFLICAFGLAQIPRRVAVPLLLLSVVFTAINNAGVYVTSRDLLEEAMMRQTLLLHRP
jgi:hypothetical protein